MGMQLNAIATPTLLAAVTALFAALTLIIARRALFPRRRGETPFCPRCRYDLSGADLGKDAVTCTECGSTSPVSRLIRGVRVRKRGPLLLSALLALLTLSAAGGWAGVVINQAGWRTYAPAFLLLRDLQSTKLRDVMLSLKELAARQSAGRLSPRSRDAMIDYLLNVQAAPANLTRDLMILPYLCNLVAQNAVHGERFNRFAEQAFRLTPLITRPQLAIGRPFNAEYSIEHRFQAPLQYQLIPREVRIDGRIIKSSPEGIIPNYAYPAYFSAMASRVEATAPTSPCRGELHLQHRFVLLADGAPIADCQVEAGSAIEFVEAECIPPVRMITDAEALDAALPHIKAAYTETGGGSTGPTQSRFTLRHLEFVSSASLPHDAYFLVFAEKDGQLYRAPASEVQMYAGERNFGLGILSDDYDRIHLDPDPQRAAENSRSTAILGQRLIFESIPTVDRTELLGVRMPRQRRALGSSSAPAATSAPTSRPVTGRWAPPLTEEERAAARSIWSTVTR